MGFRSSPRSGDDNIRSQRHPGQADPRDLHGGAAPGRRGVAGGGVGERRPHPMTDATALELDDIQQILLTSTLAITGRYEFLTFDTSAGGRAWLSELLDYVHSAADVQATTDSSDHQVTVA